MSEKTDKPEDKPANKSSIFNKAGLPKLDEALDMALDIMLTATVYNSEGLNYTTEITFEEEEKQYTALGRHLIEQNFNTLEQTSLFSNIEQAGKDYNRKYGADEVAIDFKKTFKQIGLNFNDFDFKVFEGTARLFKHSTENGFTGNAKSKTLQELKDTKYTKGYLPPAYRNIKNIPIARFTKADFFRSVGISEEDRAGRQRALETLNYFCTEPVFFGYKRLVKDNKGNPVMDDGGKYKMEDVSGIDTLFSMKMVSEEGKFKYAELEPTGLFLDQAESYFLLIPVTWRDEISKALGGKDVSKYTMKFILWLFNEYEKRRSKRFKKDKDYNIVKMSWDEIAKILKMPESLYKRNRPRAEKMINKAIDEAVKTGYLLSWKIESYINVMEFNPEKYYSPNKKSIIGKQGI